MKTLSRIWNVLGDGLEALGRGMGRMSIFPAPVEYDDDYSGYRSNAAYIKPSSAATAMRRDSQRVGRDLTAVVERELAAQEKANPPTSGSTPS